MARIVDEQSSGGTKDVRTNCKDGCNRRRTKETAERSQCSCETTCGGAEAGNGASKVAPLGELDEKRDAQWQLFAGLMNTHARGAVETTSMYGFPRKNS